MRSTRRDIRNEVRRNPGATISELADTMGLSHSTTSYHLRLLQEGGEVEETGGTNREKRYVLAGDADAQLRSKVRVVLRHRNSIRMLEYLAEVGERAAHRNEMAKVLGVSFPTVNWHMNMLDRLGLVRTIDSGFRKHFTLTDDGSDVLQQLRQFN